MAKPAKQTHARVISFQQAQYQVMLESLARARAALRQKTPQSAFGMTGKAEKGKTIGIPNVIACR